MNRNKRRAAKKRERGRVITVDYGFLPEGNQNYGLPVNCYVCDVPHTAHGLARITESGTLDVPLCERCLGGRSDITTGNAIYRKFMNAPDLKIHDGGKATTEQISAMAEKYQDAPKEH